MEYQLAFETAASLCFQVALVVLAAFMLQRWIGDARWGCRLWTTCFLSIIGLFVAALLLPHRRLFDFPAVADRPWLVELLTWQGRLVAGMLIVWSVGLALAIGQRGWRCWQLLDLLRSRCTSLDAPSILGRLGLSDPEKTPLADGENGLKPKMKSGLPANLTLKVSEEISAPFCWQLHRPVIVLPRFLVEGDDTNLRNVLLHELEHLRNRHPMQHFLQGVCSTVFWFHPAIWFAARDAELTREFVCDEAAAKSSGKFGPYLMTLARIAEHCCHGPGSRMAKGVLAFGNRKSALVRRSDRLVRLAECRTAVNRGRPLLAIGVLLMLSLLVRQIWLPTNVFASGISDWSPWPSWTAKVLHHFDIQARDFELFEDRVEIHELLRVKD